MSTAAPPRRAEDLATLNLLKAYKVHLNRHRHANVSPFSEDDVVRIGTSVRETDVPDIHGQVRQHIVEGIEGIHQGRPSQVVILAGEPGMGKSHLINYFRLPEPAERLGHILVCNSNHWKVDEFEECLLDWMLDALTRPSPNSPHLLLERVQEIGFRALRQVLRSPAEINRFAAGKHAGWLGKLWQRVTGNVYATFQRELDARDAGVFRRLNFNRFAGYVCEHFLAETGNPFHRYVMRVLLRYLFEEDRELATHWLRRRRVGNHFLRQLGAEEAIDRHFKVLDVIKVLISLFSSDVSGGLADQESNARGKVFFLAFDQTEGRRELFDQKSDWPKFFAQLSELYNALPNVFILFTMTISLRNDLYRDMELQFRDRIRRDQRFVLHSVDDAEVLGLYQQRVSRWLGDGPPEVRQQLGSCGNPYLPFDQQTVLEHSRKKTVREMLREFDSQFRRALEEVVIDVPLDYMVTLKEVRPEEETVSEYQYTKHHLATVGTLLLRFGEVLGRAAGLQYDGFEWKKVRDQKLDVLQIQFSDPATPGAWVRVFLVHLGYFYNSKIPPCLKLLSHRDRSCYQLWLTRAKGVALDPGQLGDREPQTVAKEVCPEVESVFQAVLRTIDKKDADGYSADVWEKGESFLVGECMKTYLGDLFAAAREMLQGTASHSPAPDEGDDLVSVPLDPESSRIPTDLVEAE